MMIDWVTAKVPFHFPTVISGGQFISFNREGEIEYSTEKRLQIEGSYSGLMSIRTTKVNAARETVEVEISGNPVKYLQGHNVWGSGDLPNLVLETMLKLSDALGSVQVKGYERIINAATISRVDINEMYDLGSRANCNSYLTHIERFSRTRSGTSVKDGNTIYLNRRSRRWSFKFYGKGQEIALPRNNTQGCIVLPDSVKSYADSMFRAELTLKSNELRDKGLHILGNWHSADIEAIYHDYYGRLTMPDQQLLTLPDTLPSSVRSTYVLWSEGHDVRTLLSRPTYYRHRSRLLEFGVDISSPSGKDLANESNVYPLVRTIELIPAVIPDWAYGTDLFFEPRKLCKPFALV